MTNWPRVSFYFVYLPPGCQESAPLDTGVMYVCLLPLFVSILYQAQLQASSRQLKTTQDSRHLKAPNLFLWRRPLWRRPLFFLFHFIAFQCGDGLLYLFRSFFFFCGGFIHSFSSDGVFFPCWTVHILLRLSLK